MTKLFVNANRKDFAVIQISLQNLKFPQDTVYKMPIFVQPSSKLACFHSSEHHSINWSRSHAIPPKNNEMPFPSVHHDSWLEVNRREHAHDMVSYRFRIVTLPTPKLQYV